MTKAEKAIERAAEASINLEKQYPGSSIVWLGGDYFAVIKDGNEKRLHYSAKQK